MHPGALIVYASRAFDTAKIEEDITDKKIVKGLGVCYHVPIFKKGNVHTEGLVRSDKLTPLDRVQRIAA